MFSRMFCTQNFAEKHFTWLNCIYANENELEQCSFNIMLNLSLYVPVVTRVLVSHKGVSETFVRKNEQNTSITVKINELTLDIS